MQIVYQILELRRRTIARSGRIIPCHLISPGAVKGMFRNSHQLHMGISHLFHIIRQGMGKLLVRIESLFILLCSRVLHPGTGMHFIDGHSSVSWVMLRPVFHPYAIAPVKIGNIGNAGGRPGPQFRPVAVRIRLVKSLSILRGNIKLIELSHLRIRHKTFENADFTHLRHGIGILLPVIKLPYDRNALCIGRPYGKINPFMSVQSHGMGAHFFIDIIVSALSEQILIQFTEYHFFHTFIPPVPAYIKPRSRIFSVRWSQDPDHHCIFLRKPHPDILFPPPEEQM